MALGGRPPESVYEHRANGGGFVGILWGAWTWGEEERKRAEEGRAGGPGSAGGRRRGRGAGLGSGLGRVRGLPPTLTSAEFSPSSVLRTDW